MVVVLIPLHRYAADSTRLSLLYLFGVQILQESGNMQVDHREFPIMRYHDCLSLTELLGTLDQRSQPAWHGAIKRKCDVSASPSYV